MFGMGFFEILMVAVVAIIFLGPEKLPKALVDTAKFFKTIKKTMDDAKESLDREVNLSKIKEEALSYKNSITEGVQSLTKELDLKTLELDDNLLESQKSTPQDSIDSTPKNTESTPALNANSKNIESTPIQDSKTTQDSTKSPAKTQDARAVKLDSNNPKPLSFGEHLNKEQ